MNTIGILVSSRRIIKRIQPQRTCRSLIDTCRNDEQVILQLFRPGKRTILRLSRFNYEKWNPMILPQLNQQLMRRIRLTRSRQSKNRQVLGQFCELQMVFLPRVVPLIQDIANSQRGTRRFLKGNIKPKRCTGTNGHTFHILSCNRHRHSKFFSVHRRSRTIEQDAKRMIPEYRLMRTRILRGQILFPKTSLLPASVPENRQKTAQ